MAAVLMPTRGIATVEEFEIDVNDSINELIGGSAYATEYAPPSWDISMTTTNMPVTSDRYMDWRSFLDNLRGSKKPGLFYDPKRPFPISYRLGFAGLVKAGTATPFTGAAVIVSFTNRYTINLSGLPAGFILKRSDYISFMQGDWSTLHRISANVTANGSGLATVVVEPRVPIAFTTSAIPHFDRPATLGLLVPKSIRDSHNIESGQISFKARSIVIPGTVA